MTAPEFQKILIYACEMLPNQVLPTLFFHKNFMNLQAQSISKVSYTPVEIPDLETATLEQGMAWVTAMRESALKCHQ